MSIPGPVPNDAPAPPVTAAPVAAANAAPSRIVIWSGTLTVTAPSADAATPVGGGALVGTPGGGEGGGGGESDSVAVRIAKEVGRTGASFARTSGSLTAGSPMSPYPRASLLAVHCRAVSNTSGSSPARRASSRVAFRPVPMSAYLWLMISVAHPTRDPSISSFSAPLNIWI
jgi:hypothetical protein